MSDFLRSTECAPGTQGLSKRQIVLVCQSAVFLQQDASLGCGRRKERFEQLIMFPGLASLGGADAPGTREGTRDLELRRWGGLGPWEQAQPRQGTGPAPGDLSGERGRGEEKQEDEEWRAIRFTSSPER